MSEQPSENIQPQPSPETPPAEKKLSPIAKWAFLLLMATGLILVLCLLFEFLCDMIIHKWLQIEWLHIDGLLMLLLEFGCICIFLSFILGLIALTHILGDRDKLKGIPRALISIIIPILIFLPPIIYSGPSPLAFRLMCGTNLGTISKAMALYTNDYNGKLPTASKWCDLLVIYDDLPVPPLVCQGSDDLKGESSYAMNKYVADMNMSQLPKDVVVLFETDYGRKEKRGWWKLKRMRANNEEYYSGDIRDFNTISIKRSDKLDKVHWNEAGGPEILTINHHGGDGCNILFGDGSVSFIPARDIPKLRWKP